MWTVIMKNHTWLVYFVLVSFNNFPTKVQGRLSLIVKRFELCNPKVDYPIKLYGTLRTVDGKQYIEANATSPIAFDDDVKSIFTVDLLIGKKYMQVIKFEEKHSCSSMHRYFGEFAYDVERMAGLVPGLCPIPPGRYHVHNYLLNFDKITLQNIPFGRLRFMEIATDKNNNVLLCLIAEAENKS